MPCLNQKNEQVMVRETETMPPARTDGALPESLRTIVRAMRPADDKILSVLIHNQLAF